MFKCNLDLFFIKNTQTAVIWSLFNKIFIEQNNKKKNNNNNNSENNHF